MLFWERSQDHSALQWRTHPWLTPEPQLSPPCYSVPMWDIHRPNLLEWKQVWGWEMAVGRALSIGCLGSSLQWLLGILRSSSKINVLQQQKNIKKTSKSKSHQECEETNYRMGENICKLYLIRLVCSKPLKINKKDNVTLNRQRN